MFTVIRLVRETTLNSRASNRMPDSASDSELRILVIKLPWPSIERNQTTLQKLSKLGEEHEEAQSLDRPDCIRIKRFDRD